MEGYQNFQEKLDIKILILFILRRLPDAVTRETLTDLALSEGNAGYFEYSEVSRGAGRFPSGGAGRKPLQDFRARRAKLRDRGEQPADDGPPENGKNIKPVADELRRRAMITASHETADNVCRVHLALSDGMGEILNLQMLCGGEEQAEKLEENFRKNAEKYYTQIMELLSRDEKV